MNKTQHENLRHGLRSITSLTEAIATKKGMSKQSRKKACLLIMGHVMALHAELDNATPKPRAPRKLKATSPAPEPMLAVEG